MKVSDFALLVTRLKYEIMLLQEHVKHIETAANINAQHRKLAFEGDLVTAMQSVDFSMQIVNDLYAFLDSLEKGKDLAGYIDFEMATSGLKLNGVRERLSGLCSEVGEGGEVQIF